MKTLKIIGIILLGVAIVFGIGALLYAIIPSFAEWVNNIGKASEEVPEVTEMFKLFIK